MTLVEVMVSIAILALVATMVWGGFSQTANNKMRIEKQLDRYHVIRSALDRMTRELSMAYVSAQLNPDPSLQTVITAFVGVDRGSGDRIDFTSFSHRRLYRDAHESDQNEISYFITRHPEDSKIKVLARRESARIDDDPRTGGKVEIMIEDVEDFQAEYLDPLSREWTKTWDTTGAAMHPNRLPRQIKLTIEVPHPRKRGETLTFMTRATLPLLYGLNHATYNP